jgi:hypothetical protein
VDGRQRIRSCELCYGEVVVASGVEDQSVTSCRFVTHGPSYSPDFEKCQTRLVRSRAGLDGGVDRYAVEEGVFVLGIREGCNYHCESPTSPDYS